LKRTLDIASKEGFHYTVDHRTVEIVIDEEKIPSFLDSLSRASVTYANIKIEEPSLEDFFLQVARSSQ
ncbi:MAG: hypothetical protein JSR46_03505, partial [Verrucomicrobia bacterium]|nr:hypothetical protein [Verrucomicrobiota bacterium]